LTVHYRQTDSSVIIFGNTYPLREQIKAFGGRFNGAEKNWRLPLSDETLAWAEKICGHAGGGRLAVLGETPMPMPAPGPSELTPVPEVLPPHPDTLTIGQLMDQVHRTIASAFADRIWISGEIQNATNKKSGFFLDLAEGTTAGHANSTVTVKTIIWRDSLQMMQARHGKDKIEEILQDGMKVRVRCQVQFYKERGQVSLVVMDIDPSYTKGALALAREQLLKDLRAKGLAEANKKLTLTPFPFRLGLISADASRAKSDFLDQLQSLHFPGEVLFCPTPMQGEGVPAAVAKAVKDLVRADCDVIVMTRGGGSAADLRWFDAPEIAYAIAAATVPVVCAIGHHDDVCVAEEISYRREKTPTAAADFIVAWFTATAERIERLAVTMAKSLENRLELLTATTAGLIERLHSTAVMSLEQRTSGLVRFAHQIDQLASRTLYAIDDGLSRLMQRIASASDQTLFAFEMALQKFASELARRDPAPWLEKGWTRLQKDGQPVLSVTHLQPGDKLTTRLLDGRLSISVDTVEPSSSSQERKE
jgi:exodeoxyribonuclease VII large subunit